MAEGLDAGSIGGEGWVYFWVRVLKGLTRGSDTESPQSIPPALVPKSSEHFNTHVINHPHVEQSSQDLKSSFAFSLPGVGILCQRTKGNEEGEGVE